VSSGQQSYGVRIASAFRTHFRLRRTWWAFALSAQSLMILGGIGSFARAEDHAPSPKVAVSACLPTFGLAAPAKDPKIQLDMRKGGQFARTAFMHMLAGDYERAFEQFAHAININPVNPVYYIQRGIARTINDEFNRAVEDFDKAIALDPTSSVAFYGRGQAYVQMTEYDRGIEDLDEAVKLLPGNAAAYMIRGSAYTKADSGHIEA
jgi:tetratricopeptide (TPR) repeat protein